MSQIQIFYPLIVLVFLTFSVLVRMAFVRLRAVKNGEVHPKVFLLGEAASVPAKVTLVNRNYMNLLELPVLFYVACLVLFVTNSVSSLSLTLAWLYVLSRIAHSFIHLTYNNTLHRLYIFGLSSLILLLLWLTVIGGILHQG